MKKYTNVIGIFITTSIFLLSGCAASGMFPSAHITEVQLQKNNFKIVAQNAYGEAEAAYILGATYSLGIATNTMAVARVEGSGMLYKEALENLWNNFEASNGKVAGRRLALANVRYDSDALNLVVYTKAKIMIRADIIEFTEQ